MKEITLKKTVSRTYSLKDGWFYKVQFDMECLFWEEEAGDIDVDVQYAAMWWVLDKQLKDEKEKLGL